MKKTTKYLMGAAAAALGAWFFWKNRGFLDQARSKKLANAFLYDSQRIPVFFTVNGKPVTWYYQDEPGKQYDLKTFPR
jgi:hypothetical protein